MTDNLRLGRCSKCGSTDVGHWVDGELRLTNSCTVECNICKHEESYILCFVPSDQSKNFDERRDVLRVYNKT